jgi:hypothetical protein
VALSRITVCFSHKGFKYCICLATESLLVFPSALQPFPVCLKADFL